MWPRNLVLLLISTVSWYFTQPALARCAHFTWDWLAQIYIRNLALMWLVYGGWRDLYAVALEAWNGFPAKLTDALSIGRCSHLAPGEHIETTTALIAYSGLESVKSVSAEGIVSA